MVSDKEENIYYMDKFTVTTGNKVNRFTRVIALRDMWNRQYHNTLSSLSEKYRRIEECSQEELMKVALCGVKYVKYIVEVEREKQRVNASYNTPFAVKKTVYHFMDDLYYVISRIMLKNLINIFPVEKTYDGDKRGCKDYFYTMEILKKKGMDNILGGGNCAFELMRDYENRDLREVTVFYMSCMSAMYKHQSGEIVKNEQ